MYRAIFLDRDGVINEAEKYVVHPDDFTFLPGAIEALKLISKKDYKIIVITNQSGVRRGYYDEEMLQRIHQKMLDSCNQMIEERRERHPYEKCNHRRAHKILHQKKIGLRRERQM